MSSEFSIHLDAGKLMAGEVVHFTPNDFSIVNLNFGGAKVKLFVWPAGREELATLLRQAAWDLVSNLIAPCTHGLECLCYQDGYEAERRPVGA